MGFQPVPGIAVEPVLSTSRASAGSGVVCCEEAGYGAAVMTTTRLAGASQNQDLGATPRVMTCQPALAIALQPVLNTPRDRAGSGVVCCEEAAYGGSVMTTQRTARPSRREEVGGTSPLAGVQLTLPLSFGGSGRGPHAVSGGGGACPTATAPTVGSSGLRQSVQEGGRPALSSAANEPADTSAGPSSTVGTVNPPPAGGESETGGSPASPAVAGVVQAGPGLAGAGERDSRPAKSSPGRHQSEDVAGSETVSDAGKVGGKAQPFPEKLTRDSRSFIGSVAGDATLEALRGRVEELIAAAYCPRYQRRLDREGTAWIDWCAARDYPPVPAEPWAVEMYLSGRAGKGPCNLDAAVAAIAAAHRKAGVASPLHQHGWQLLPEIRAVLAGIRGEARGRPPAPTLTAAGLRRFATTPPETSQSRTRAESLSRQGALLLAAHTLWPEETVARIAADDVVVHGDRLEVTGPDAGDGSFPRPVAVIDTEADPVQDPVRVVTALLALPRRSGYLFDVLTSSGGPRLQRVLTTVREALAARLPSLSTTEAQLDLRARLLRTDVHWMTWQRAKATLLLGLATEEPFEVLTGQAGHRRRARRRSGIPAASGGQSDGQLHRGERRPPVSGPRHTGMGGRRRHRGGPSPLPSAADEARR